MATEGVAGRPLQEQLDEFLREVNDHRASVAGRFAAVETKHADLHAYVGQAIGWQQTLDRKIHTNTRAVESLAVTVGKTLDRQDAALDELKLLKKVIFKMARKMGIT